MPQSDCNRIVFTALLVLILSATITSADINSCRKFCNAHRPGGSSADYTITCAEAKDRKGTEMSSCKGVCESCSEFCSNEHFRCPKSEQAFLAAYSSDDSEYSNRSSSGAALILLILILGLPIGCVVGIVACVVCIARPAGQNQFQSGYNYYGMQQPVGQMPMNQQYQYQPYQPQVGVGGALGTQGMGPAQNYPA